MKKRPKKARRKNLLVAFKLGDGVTREFIFVETWILGKYNAQGRFVCRFWRAVISKALGVRWPAKGKSLHVHLLAPAKTRIVRREAQP
jgi:hypothetical protein